MLEPRLDWLLVFVPVAIALRVAGVSDVAVFATAALAIVPLAGLIGRMTEDLAVRSGPRVGGLLNATFGNVTEMIVSIFLILDGELEVVKASLTGSIIGNVLLVLGMAFLFGGWRREEQTFSQASAGLYTGSLVIAVVALMMPAVFALSPQATHAHTEAVSIGVAVVLVVMYALAMLFSLKTHQSLFRSKFGVDAPRWSFARAAGVLGAATVGVAGMSELLASALQKTVVSLGISKFFVGIIVLPIIGNAAEHGTAVFLAVKDKADVAVEIAIG